MAWLSLVATVGLVLAADGAGPERETLPFFVHIANSRDNSALSMECEGDPLKTIECSFTQVTVTVYGAQQVEDARAQMKQAPLTAAQRNETRQSLCSPQTPPPSINGPLERVALKARVLAQFKRVCSCPDDACFDREIVDTLAAQERKCKVWTHTFKATLKRVIGQHKWVGTSEPSGPCQAVNATVLESDEDGLFWTFTQTRLTADTTSRQCKGPSVSEPATYSSKINGAALLGCEVVEFGR